MFVPYFAHLHVLVSSQKHGDDQFSMILQQITSYLLVCQMNNLIIYNTHLTHDWYKDTSGTEKPNYHQAHHHHHRGQK